MSVVFAPGEISDRISNISYRHLLHQQGNIESLRFAEVRSTLHPRVEEDAVQVGVGLDHAGNNTNQIICYLKYMYDLYSFFISSLSAPDRYSCGTHS